MKATLEVVMLPVCDVDRALGFYRDRLGFTLDVDYAPAPDFRVVQLTPPGSETSIQFGAGLPDAPTGSVQGLYLVVDDIVAAREELVRHGVGVTSIRHKDVDTGQWRGRFRLGVDPHRTDYASFADFSDPDGNRWVLQERGNGNE